MRRLLGHVRIRIFCSNEMIGSYRSGWSFWVYFFFKFSVFCLVFKLCVRKTKIRQRQWKKNGKKVSKWVEFLSYLNSERLLILFYMGLEGHFLFNLWKERKNYNLFLCSMFERFCHCKQMVSRKLFQCLSLG